MVKRAKNTKAALIDAAHQLFAERGFEGVSIAEIAGELGITKQALLHHFGSKEKLYGQVLEELSVRFETIVERHVTGVSPPREQFYLIMRDLYRHMLAQTSDAKLILRELLDNKPRIKDKQRWYLRPFLESLTELIQTVSGSRPTTRAEAFARTYQIIGAIHYFAISDPTLKQMFGESMYRDIEATFLSQMEGLV